MLPAQKWSAHQSNADFHSSKLLRACVIYCNQKESCCETNSMATPPSIARNVPWQWKHPMHTSSASDISPRGFPYPVPSLQPGGDGQLSCCKTPMPGVVQTSSYRWSRWIEFEHRKETVVATEDTTSKSLLWPQECQPQALVLLFLFSVVDGRHLSEPTAQVLLLG